MNRFLQELFWVADHWATTACPVINDRLSYKMWQAKPRHTVNTTTDSMVPLAVRVFMARTFTGARYAGAKQRVFIHTGYDTFAVNNSLWYDGIQVFDVNPPQVSADKRHRLELAGEKMQSNIHYIDCDDFLLASQRLAAHGAYDGGKTTFIHLGSLPLYSDRKSFEQLLAELFKIIPPYSSVVFAYKNEKAPDGYSYNQMESLLSEKGYHIYEHMTADRLHNDCFRDFEVINRRRFDLPDKISFCLAVKKITA